MKAQMLAAIVLAALLALLMGLLVPGGVLGFFVSR